MANYYVATDGADTNDGSIDSPFATITHGIGACSAGDVCFIRGGTYRHITTSSSEINGSAATAQAHILVTAYPNETPIIKGSDIVTGWTLYSGSIYQVSWATNSQQVFVDFDTTPSTGLQQIGMPSSLYDTTTYPNPVGTGLADMIAGSFFYDPNAQILYVWLADSSDPNDHVMEASVGGTSGRTLFFHHDYFDLNGLTFRHSNDSAHQQIGGALNPGGHCTVSNCDIQYCDFMGAMLSSTAANTTYQNCIISNNGAGGITASQHIGGIVQSCTVMHNNTRGFGQDWAAAAIKLSAESQVTITDCEVGNNNCTGIWSDTCHTTTNGHFVARNYVHDNTIIEGGIMMEVTTQAMVVNNIVANCRRRGIFLSTAADCIICNNTIVGTVERAALEYSGGARAGVSTGGNIIKNNLVINTDTASGCNDFYASGDDGTSQIDYNNYWRSDGTLQFHDDTGNPTTFAGWQSQSGWDANGYNEDPKFVTGKTGADAYALDTGSPMILAGANLGALFQKDYKGNWRASGAFDLGAIAFSTGSAPVIGLWNVEASGTQAATIGTEHTLDTPTTNSTYVLWVDTSAMDIGDILELRIYNSLDGTTYKQAFLAVFANGQGNPAKLSPPVPIELTGKFSLKQTTGTGRSYPWKLLRM